MTLVIGAPRVNLESLSTTSPCILSAPQVVPTPEGCLVDRTNVAFDVGGAVDFYPTRSTILRVEAGDRMIRFTRTELPPVWTHNFQVDVGAGWRF